MGTRAGLPAHRAFRRVFQVTSGERRPARP
jgi:hypothetical protein